MNNGGILSGAAHPGPSHVPLVWGFVGFAIFVFIMALFAIPLIKAGRNEKRKNE